ncbi:MAG: DNA-binding protein [archaeon]|nr:DNA-binding protein [archaeon]
MGDTNFYTMKLSDGEELIQNILELVKEKQITYGEIISGRGKIREFELVSTGQKRSLDKSFFSESFGISAITGKVRMSKGEIFHTINVSVSKSGYNATKGQLMRGIVDGELEITVRKVNLAKIIEA